MDINLQETPVSDINVTNQFDLFMVGNTTFHWKHKENNDIEFTGSIEEFNEFLLEKIEAGIIHVPEQQVLEEVSIDTTTVDIVTTDEVQNDADASVTE